MGKSGMGVGCMGGAKGLNKEVRWQQMVKLRVVIMARCTHKGPLFYYNTHTGMYTDSWTHIRCTLPNWSTPLVTFHQSSIYIFGQQKALWKSRHIVDTSQWRQWTYLYIVNYISWGNKMNFSLQLYANMSGYCSDSHI